MRPIKKWKKPPQLTVDEYGKKARYKRSKFRWEEELQEDGDFLFPWDDEKEEGSETL